MIQDRPPTIGGLVLAAGGARRFGSAKQLVPYRGRPLLEHALAAMADASAIGGRIVVLGANAEEILMTVDLHGALPVICPGWAEGQAASLRAGVAALRADVDAVVITLGDQPLIDPRAINLLAASRDGASDAIRAGYAGRPGHPVLIERPLFAPAMALRGDQGARELLADARVVSCDGLGSDLDIDLPQDLSAAGSTPPR